MYIKVKRASLDGNERQEMSGRRKAGRKGRGKKEIKLLVLIIFVLQTQLCFDNLY